MKKIILLITVLALSMPVVWSQGQENNSIPLIGSTAPTFSAESTNGLITFPIDFGNHWKILISHPKDFTPVCSSELLELANLQQKFDQLNVKIAVVSTDELSQNDAWKKSLESIDYKGHQTPEIKFPLISDKDKAISAKYGMLHYPVSTTKDVRGVFIIDPDDVVQAVFFYPMDVGRNIDEIVRTVEALQEAHNNVVTPADWNPGEDVMLSYLNKQQEKEEMLKNPNIYQIVWYMTMEKNPSH